MTKRLLMVALGVVMVMAAVPAAGASDVGIAQPTELFPPDGEVPVLYPPDSEWQGHADLVVLIDRGRFDRTWRDVREIIEQADGWIVGASSAVGEHEGRTYEYGKVEMRVPAFRFEEAIGWFAALGQTIGADIAYEASRGVDSTIMVTITEEGGPSYTLKANDTAHFPLGAKIHWKITQEIKKFFVVRTAEPLEL